MLDIERLIDQKVPRARLENFPYVYTALFDEDKGGKGGKGGVKPVRGYRTSRGYSFGRRGK
jgi:ATP-dependent RNA helicase RhlE